MNSPMHLLSPIDRLRAALTDAARAERTVLISLAAYWVLWTIYGTIAKREKNRPAVDGLVSAWAKKHTQPEAIALCDAAEVPCGMVASVDEIFRDPHYAARGNIARVKDPRVGDLAVPNVVPRLTGTPGGVDTLGPPLGQHNAEIYGGLLGLTKAELAALEEEGVI